MGRLRIRAGEGTGAEAGGIMGRIAIEYRVPDHVAGS